MSDGSESPEGYIPRSRLQAMLAAERLSEAFRHQNAYLRHPGKYLEWSDTRATKLLRDLEDLS